MRSNMQGGHIRSDSLREARHPDHGMSLDELVKADICQREHVARILARHDIPTVSCRSKTRLVKARTCAARMCAPPRPRVQYVTHRRQGRCTHSCPSDL